VYSLQDADDKITYPSIRSGFMHALISIILPGTPGSGFVVYIMIGTYS
jgi:hypothetical protein